MVLTRRYHRFCLYVTLLVCYLIFCFATVFLIHHLWCSSKDVCSTRFFCANRPPVLLINRTKILEKEYSLCSIRSARRGPHQRVIGVSAYLSKQDNIKLLPTLWKFLLEYVAEAQREYPDWIVRIYYYSLNVSKEEIFRVEDTYQNVDFCDSTNIPVFGDILSWYPGKMQRFLPLADPLVDIYMSRDVDSPILERETAVVRSWLRSNKTMHFIRDHPEHAIPILGGLWGIKLNREQPWRKNMSEYLLSPDFVRCYTGALDQNFLEEYLWPHADKYRHRTAMYDSFHCRKFAGSLPFPTRKESPTRFVGCRRPNCTRDKHAQCPKACRPPNHPDWIWC